MSHPLSGELQELLQKAGGGQATDTDYTRLAELINADESGEIIGQVEQFLEQEEVSSPAHIKPYDHAYWQQAFIEMQKAYQSQQPPAGVKQLTRSRYWMAAAAVMLLAIGAALTIIVSSDRPSSQPVVSTVQPPVDIAPGKNGAILTLADGSDVLLDSVASGTVIALQGGATAKVVNGALVYEGVGDHMTYNTMTTPKGRQFQLTLPDGSKVWLNASSSIRYPTSFKDDGRQVTITGEAYFEVAKNERSPFLINVNEQMNIRVLGTHFNVAAYENEPGIYTTLLEGRIQVLKANAVILKPGQQARLLNNDASGKVQVLEKVNVGNVVAWKDGYFNFQGLTYEEVMRQLERWYNIQVVIGKDVPQRSLGGEMTKDVPLNGVLDYFTDLGVHYRLEGRKLTILP